MAVARRDAHTAKAVENHSCRALLLAGFPAILVLILFAMVGAVQAEPQPKQTLLTVVDAAVVNVRSAPELGPDNIIIQVKQGDQLKALGQEQGWVQIQLQDGQIGWIHSRFARVDEVGERLEVTATVARIRASSNLSSAVVGRAPRGTMLSIKGREGRWYNVELPDQTQGWIREDLVTLHSVQPSMAAMGPSEEGMLLLVSASFGVSAFLFFLFTLAWIFRRRRNQGAYDTSCLTHARH